MIFRLFHPSISKGLDRISRIGAANGCPFCKARIEKELEKGDEIVLLAVGAPPEVLRRLAVQTDLYLKIPTPDVPRWALSLCVEDNCLVDDVLMRIACREIGFGTLKFDLKQLSHLIAFCWIHRIPIVPSEMSEFLIAHGHPSKLRKQTEDAFESGAYLLITANGKRPIKRRKMNPFEVFKYVPSCRKEEKIELYDWLYGPALRYSDTQRSIGI